MFEAASKVAKLDSLGVFGDEDVVGFDVSMEEAIFVEVAQSNEHLSPVGDHSVDAQPYAFPVLRQGFPQIQIQTLVYQAKMLIIVEVAKQLDQILPLLRITFV